MVISQKEGDIAYDIQVSGNHNIRGGNCKNIYKFITSHMQKGARAVHRKGLSPKGLFTECPLVWAFTERPY